MEKSFGLLFFLKKPRGYKQGPLLVYVLITVDGSARDLSTKRLVDPAKGMGNTGGTGTRLKLHRSEVVPLPLRQPNQRGHWRHFHTSPISE